VPGPFAARYRKLELTANAFPKVGQAWATGKLNPDDIASAYGMIENIDGNFARLMKALDDRKLTDNTLVIFLTDNGPGGVRFNAGLRNRKGTVYEGGVRVPCYVRWPAQVKPSEIVTPLAHIDMTPTLVEACGVGLGEVKDGWDGRSFLPLLKGEPGKWPDRTLFFQWHRGDVPEKYRAFAARAPRYKLVQAAGMQPNVNWQPKFELFDIANDPFELNDLASEKPDEVARLKREYEGWFDDVTKQGFDPPRIIVGSVKENPVRLSRQDWRGPKAGWAADSVGHWEIEFARAGDYRYRLWVNGDADQYRIAVERPNGNATQTFGGTLPKPVSRFERINSETAGPRRVRAEVSDLKGEAWRGVTHLEVEYLGSTKKQ
jgi:hypothetical protein